MFERETWKKISQGRVSLKRNMLHEFQLLSMNIAQSLFKQGSILLPFQAIESCEQPLLVGIPVHIANGQISFFHKSILEYFIAQAWVSCMNSSTTNMQEKMKQLLSVNVVSEETGVLDFLSQQIESHHISLLVEQVWASRLDKSEPQQTASSNAMSILNAANFSFAGMDFSNISIPFANLEGAVMRQTNLSHSNLSGCKLVQAWMKGANLQNSEMANIQIGELAWVDYGCECRCICEKSWTIVTGHNDASIKVWNMASRKLLGEPLQGHIGRVTSVSIYDGKIVSGGDDMTIRVWDMTTMKQIGDPLRGHTGGVNCVAVLDGKIVSGSKDKTIRIWDIAKMEQIGILKGHTRSVNSVAAFYGRIVSNDEFVILEWDIETMEQIGKRSGNPSMAPNMSRDSGGVPQSFKKCNIEGAVLSEWLHGALQQRGAIGNPCYY